LQSGGPERLADQYRAGSRRQQRRADRGAELPASQPHRNLPFGRGVLPPVLFPCAQNRLDRRGDAAQPRDAAAALARGGRVLRLPARAPEGEPLNFFVITADDFGLSHEVNEAIVRAHKDGILTAASLMVSGAGAQEAVAIARKMPSLRVGLHLVLIEGRPTL